MIVNAQRANQLISLDLDPNDHAYDVATNRIVEEAIRTGHDVRPGDALVEGSSRRVALDRAGQANAERLC